MKPPVLTLKIAHRVLLLGIAALLGIALISTIFIGERQIQAGYNDRLGALAEREADVSRLAVAFNQSVRSQQQFLLTKDMAFAARFRETLADAGSKLSALGLKAPADMTRSIEAVSTGFQTYGTAVETLIARNVDLGLTPASGFEGAMRDAVHSIEKQLEPVDNAELRASMLTLRRHEKDFILRRDASYLKKHGDEITTFTALLKKAFPPGVQRMRASEALAMYRDAFALYARGTLDEVAARAAVEDRVRAIEPLFADVQARFAAARAAGVADMQSAARRTLTIVAALLAATVLALLAGVSVIGRSISRPVVRVTQAMRELADGRTDLVVPGLVRRDEFGAMASALEVFRQSALANQRLEAEAVANRMRAEAERLRMQADAEAEAGARLAQAVTGLAAGLRRLAEGDLSFVIAEPFAPDFESLREDLNQALYQLSGTMNDVADASRAIDSGSREISLSAGDLAQRTERQAASLEETAAALDQLTATVSTSARRAQEALVAAQTAKGDTDDTGRIVAKTIEAMHRIEESSSHISTILGVIDGIAFQTNLLALNAGVEAARAGEAGRGFAVVAHEVRELAQRSAKAAKDIKSLILASGAEVEEGARCVRQTGDALNAIGDHVKRINAHVEAIAEAAREQADGLSQINTAVNQMDQATQQNAAMVEESTAASATLAEEAARLNRMIANFRLPTSDTRRYAA